MYPLSNPRTYCSATTDIKSRPQPRKWITTPIYLIELIKLLHNRHAPSLPNSFVGTTSDCAGDLPDPRSDKRKEWPALWDPTGLDGFVERNWRSCHSQLPDHPVRTARGQTNYTERPSGIPTCEGCKEENIKLFVLQKLVTYMNGVPADAPCLATASTKMRWLAPIVTFSISELHASPLSSHPLHVHR